MRRSLSLTMVVASLLVVPVNALGDAADAVEIVLRRAEDQGRLHEFSRLLQPELGQYKRTGSDVSTSVTHAMRNVQLAQNDADKKQVQKRTTAKPTDFFLLQNDRKFSLEKMKGKLAKPVAGPIDVPYGTEKLSGTITEIRHTGLTYRVEKGTDVTAVADGLVVFAQTFPGYGLTAMIDHGQETHSVYAHLDAFGVVQGDTVTRGQTIAASGASDSFDGAKLYFELRVNGRAVDPTPYLSK